MPPPPRWSAAVPSVQIHGVPGNVGMYGGLGEPFTLADLPAGLRVTHANG
ncbi:hypothetical protein [Micromonospora sp. DPT]